MPTGREFQLSDDSRGSARLAELKRIWKAEAWLERWEGEHPEAAKILRGGLEASLTFYRYPKSHWRRIRSTNALERLHAEIKRRNDALGAFPDRKSALKAHRRLRAPRGTGVGRSTLP